MQFEYPEDREFFAQLLTSGDEKKLEEEFADYFDFRHPAIKRWEFNKTKKEALDALAQKHDGKCQLRIHPDCSKDGKFEPDHIIPLSTNELNKKLRRLTRTAKEKVIAQSFGSNDLKNLTLACKRCNALKKHRIILPHGLFSSDNLQFVGRRVEDEVFRISSNKFVLIRKHAVQFKKWTGLAIPNTYGNKAVIDYNGEPVFAELAVLRLFQSNGWQGVWADSYGRKFRTGLPDVAAPIVLPSEQQKLYDAIKLKTGLSGGCWDVFLRRGNEILFIELKRQKKDRIQSSQDQWLAASLSLGLKPQSFALIEWGT